MVVRIKVKSGYSRMINDQVTCNKIMPAYMIFKGFLILIIRLSGEKKSKLLIVVIY